MNQQAPKMDLKALAEKSRLPANQAGISTVKAFFEQNKNAMAAVLPRHVKPDRMLRIALGAFRATPKLMQATTESLMGAIMQCAQLGLEPNTPLGHAYLIPFNNKRAKRTDVQVIFGYRGLIDLARRSGQIESIAAHAVRENDDFDFSYGLDDKLHHKPSMTNRGEIIAFYAVAKMKDGGHAFEVMSLEQVETIRDRSQNYQSAVKYGKETPWHTDFEEMGRKTTVRRLFKYLPVSIEMATATMMDDIAESGGNQHTETALEGEYTIIPDDYEQVNDTDEDNQSQVVDQNGEVFNPEIHASDEDGNPVLNQDGSFRYRKGAKKAAEEKQEQGATFADIATAINTAKNQQTLDDAISLSSDLPDDQRKELGQIYEAAKRSLAGSSS